MFKRNSNFNSMKRICFIIISALMIAGSVSSLLLIKPALADSPGKVYVCKYVGKPGVDERLQTGQNPIEVSVNAIPQPVVIGSYFPDKQGRSYVLGFVPMDPEPTRDNCPPPDAPTNASATLTIGVCNWTHAEGSLTPVTIELVHASLTINGMTYITSQTITLPPGSYPYTWTAMTGYTGSGNGTLDIKDCKPGKPSATVTLGDCSWTPEHGSLTPVTITLNHASLTINNVTYTTSQTIYLPPGRYPYTWKADPGYSADGSNPDDIGDLKDCSGSGTLDVKDCSPITPSAMVTLGDCSWTPEHGSQTPVTITLNHASLTINGVTYYKSQTIYLPPGKYHYTWKADYKHTENGIDMEEVGNLKDCSGSGTLVVKDCTPGNASASVTKGICNWTQEAGSLTPVSITLNHAALTIHGVTYISSQIINLPPGSYPYSWAAETGYIGNGSGTIVIGDCTPGTASASVTTGACTWSQATGSLTPVALDLDHASLTIHGVTYTTSQTISLSPGSYPYSWAAVTGYIGNGSGTIVIGDCTPGTASASVTTGACAWSRATGSLTPVTLHLDHASLTIHGVTYPTSQTINLSPGSYPYNWTAEIGYLGNGSGTVVIGDCTPGVASASVTTGACGWSQATGSLTPVTLDLDHASLIIHGITYTAPQIIDLPPGSYPYSWTAEAGYIGDGSGTVVIGDCTPGTATVSVVTGACNWTQAAGSMTPVSIDLNHASLTINSLTYTDSQTIYLPPGSYPYNWTSETGYIGEGSGTVEVGDCTPGTASASVTQGTCGWTQATGSLTPLSIDLNHASLTINAVTYSATQTIELPPGSYPYSWKAETGYIGEGSGTVDIEDCTPGTASATVTAGACHWTDSGGSLTPVTLELEHASIMINGTTYTTSQTIQLPPGSYPYSWTAETGYFGGGSGTIDIGDCMPGTASASVTAGKCKWTQAGGSLTPVTIEVNHASLTINGVTYTSSQTIKLPPGSYPYSWTAADGYTGSGSGTIGIGSCPPPNTPENASASVTTGICSWSQVGGSLTLVFIEMNHASLMIQGMTYTTSQTINLPPGSYPYNWTALSGYSGNGSGVIVIRDCPPILIPVSGVDKGFMNYNLPGFFFGLSLDTNALNSFSAHSFNLNPIQAVIPARISTDRHLRANAPGPQSTGLIPNRLVIPSINLDAPIVPVGYQETAYGGQVFNQWLTPVQYAAGWHVTSALLGDPGNTVLNGHHNAFGKVFIDLVKLQIGDTISVYSGTHEFQYQVVSNMLLPEGFESLSSRIENARWIESSLDERITLVTCWPENGNTHRVVIIARPMSNADQPPSP